MKGARGSMRLAAVLSTIFRHPKAREVIGLLVTASALLLLVSLVSFSPHDPSFFHYVSREEAPRNFGGLVGAHVAGDLLGIVGIAAFLFPLALFWLGFTLIVGGNREPRAVEVVGFFCLFISTCLLFSLLQHQGIVTSFGGGQPGGFLGALLFHVLRPALGPFGLYLATLTGMLLCVILISQGSFVGLIRSLREIVAWLGSG
ncbi:MAG: DNA translocase FtsK 4TM domain-containing protein, partial [Candidatus Methylomirabilales bacterium]